MSDVRIGIIGCGGMGQQHMKALAKMPGVKLTAASDSFADNLKKVSDEYKIQGFDDGEKMLDSGLLDGVVVATPHYFHPPLVIAAMKRGIHVLCEKPVAVTAKAAAQINATHAQHPNVIYGVMYQMRTVPRWQTVKKIIDSGRIGKLQRMTYVATDWFRSQSYYNSGSWRATWAGEGGGVLMNQCPHNIDIMYWLLGLPKRIEARITLGKYHKIEVEDDVTAFFEYPNGATGVFITTTGEFPGSHLMEIVGDRGKVTIPKVGNIELIELDGSTQEGVHTSKNSFNPNLRSIKSSIEVPDGGSHEIIHASFAEAIRTKDASKLIVQGDEGLHSVEMINAMIMSGIRKQPIDLPTDREAFEVLLKELIAYAKK